MSNCFCMMNKVCDVVHNCVSEDAAKLILRLTIGILVLFHGIFKVTNPGAVDWIGGLFTSIHLPGFLAYLVYIGEIVAPIMLIMGYRTKLAAALIVITIVVAILLAHLGEVFTLGATGAPAIELQLMYLFGAVAIMGLGAGKYSFCKKKELV